MLTPPLPTITIASATNHPPPPSPRLSTITNPRLPANITVEPVTPSTLPSYRRMITTLLPIRYQDKYYAESIADPTDASLALCAVWRDPRAGTRGEGKGEGEAKGEVVAGIQCRLEPVPGSSTSSSIATSSSASLPHQNGILPTPRHPPVSPPLRGRSEPHRQLYISTLATLSPHRRLGLATLLLDSILHTLLTHPNYAGIKVVALFAHVWEANLEALEWYQRRGFSVEDRVVEGYYRRLRPSGGRVARRAIGVGDSLRAGKGKGGGLWEKSSEADGDKQGVGDDGEKVKGCG